MGTGMSVTRDVEAEAEVRSGSRS